MKRLLPIICAVFLSAPAWAHKGSDAYLDVRQQDQALALQLSVALKDLDLLIPVDANADGNVTWAEVQTATPAALALLQSHTGLDSSTAGCTVKVTATDGHTLVTYTGLEEKLEPIPDPAVPLGTPAELKSTEELFLGAQHLEQYRHATYEPADYYEE